MEISGSQFIGRISVSGNDHSFYAYDAATGDQLAVAFSEATAEEVDQASKLAEQAFASYANKSNEEKATFLERIADEILNLGDALIERCMQETALPEGRLKGERGRTMNQLKLFAKVVREGSWVDARIDTAQPNREPLPKADIRQVVRPLGPVAVFGASNFPLAFSVAGGDTASALAAGCPVIVKGHPAHPGTSELVARAILVAAEATGMPDGVFSMVQGTTHEVGIALVQHPLIKAVGFTGSFKGGKALFDLANQREEPIPVYAEMGSSNPLFILPEAMKNNGPAIAKAFSGSVTLGVGQFCTNPGLVFLPKQEETDGFKSELAAAIEPISAGNMLTSGIRDAYSAGTESLTRKEIEILATGAKAEGANAVPAKIFYASYEKFASDKTLEKEVFGPSSVLVEVSDAKQVMEAAQNLEGHLTATIHGTPKDLEDYAALISILERKVGRIIINGYPTGVEVCDSMVHGGPYPATTAPQTTSVGTNAIKRFGRPVCYQSFPNRLLPDAIKDENPLQIWRLVDGAFTKDSIR
ncbi:MAG: aldehyde dehydrogenase (NADP(+)) [Saprospiraceae bacterium]|nr:aldehyde dehydrogenase (NADP(+)) [Saprospiraceae bacterium]